MLVVACESGLRAPSVTPIEATLDPPDAAAAARLDAIMEPEPEVAPSVDVAVRVIGGLRGQFRACYEAGLRRDPRMLGSVTITTQIDETGHVAFANPTKRTGLDDAVAECLAAIIRTARFEAPAKPWTMNVPVAFKPMREDAGAPPRDAATD
jgi:hypothetical protein